MYGGTKNLNNFKGKITMKKFVYTLLALTIGFTSCSKWTETESKAEDFEKAALEDLKEQKRRCQMACRG